eukprot:4962893-Amphidinium_carterae.1
MASAHRRGRGSSLHQAILATLASLCHPCHHQLVLAAILRPRSAVPKTWTALSLRLRAMDHIRHWVSRPASSKTQPDHQLAEHAFTAWESQGAVVD